MLFVYHIALYFGQRKQLNNKSMLYFAFFVLSLSGYILTRIVCDILDVSILIVSIEALFASCAFFCIGRFFNLVLKKPSNKLLNIATEILLLLGIVLGLTSIIMGVEWYLRNMFRIVVILYFLAMLMISFSFIIQTFKQKLFNVNYIKTIFTGYFILILYLVIVKFLLSINNNNLVARNHLFVGIIAYSFSFALAQKANIELHLLFSEKLKGDKTNAKHIISFNFIDETINKYSLTPRETEVVKYVSKGFGYKEIAEKMNISTRTVIRHIQNIFEKADVHNKVELLNKLSK